MNHRRFPRPPRLQSGSSSNKEIRHLNAAENAFRSLRAHCVTLWIGKALGAIERACLKSVLRQGHTISLYCYEPVMGVPEGVEIRDAAEILPAESIVRHHSGSVALFSNWFRYELQRRALGTWLDCDAYLVAPLESESPYLFGEQAPGEINVGVLRIPPDSPLLPALIEPFYEKTVPRWLLGRARPAAYWRLLTTGRSGIAKMPWGYLGPTAMTSLAKQHGLFQLALSPEVLYPVRWQDADWIMKPELKVEDVTTPRTVSIHLWNSKIEAFKDQPAPPGSFLSRLQHEGQA